MFKRGAAATTAVNSATLGGTVAQSCRVRLARNLSREHFPDSCTDEERRRIFERVSRAALKVGGLREPSVINVDEEDELLRQQILEMRLISSDLLERGSGAGLVMGSDGALSVMINEEDHLRIQAIQPGMEIDLAYEMADGFDSRLDKELDFAFSARLGYLTSCPSNLGTGLRASVMVQLLGLRLTDDLEAVLRALERMRVAVRGIDGEGSEAAGHMFQISNQGTLGLSEREVLDALKRQVAEVVRQERFARLRLMRDAPWLLEDCVARSLAILQHARIIEAGEAFDHLSALQLGAELDMLRQLTAARTGELALAVQPGNLQRIMGSCSDPDKRDVFRAAWLRSQLAEVEFCALEKNGKR